MHTLLSCRRLFHASTWDGVRCESQVGLRFERRRSGFAVHVREVNAAALNFGDFNADRFVRLKEGVLKLLCE